MMTDNCFISFIGHLLMETPVEKNKLKNKE